MFFCLKGKDNAPQIDHFVIMIHQWCYRVNLHLFNIHILSHLWVKLHQINVLFDLYDFVCFIFSNCLCLPVIIMTYLMRDSKYKLTFDKHIKSSPHTCKNMNHEIYHIHLIHDYFKRFFVWKCWLWINFWLVTEGSKYDWTEPKNCWEERRVEDKTWNETRRLVFLAVH